MRIKVCKLNMELDKDDRKEVHLKENQHEDRIKNKKRINKMSLQGVLYFIENPLINGKKSSA